MYILMEWQGQEYGYVTIWGAFRGDMVSPFGTLLVQLAEKSHITIEKSYSGTDF